jgi:hypothetical protein
MNAERGPLGYGLGRRWLLGTTAAATIWVGIAGFGFAAAVGALKGAPKPMVHDEHSYLLAGELYAQFRWSAPPPRHPEFFETFHELTAPRRASKYPIGQGIAIAIGIWLGHPALGIWLSCGALGAALFWALRGYLPLGWAIGGALAGQVMFGGTTYWAQSYWGGAVAASGGALVFGALRRLCRRPGWPAGLAMGAGVCLLLHSRPFEGALFCVVPAVVLASSLWRQRREPAARNARVRALAPTLGLVVAGFAVLFAVNAAVTGSWSRFPHAVYDARYQSVSPLVWQAAKERAPDIPARMARFDAAVARSSAGYRRPILEHVVRRINSTAAFYLGPLLGTAALISIGTGLGHWRRVALATTLVTCASLLLSVYHQLHYQAPLAVTCLYLGVAGSRSLWLRLGPARRTGAATVFLLGHVFWFLTNATMPREPIVESSYEALARAVAPLQGSGGRHLVFVSYERAVPPHVEFVYNGPDLESAGIVWARDLGASNARLIAAYPDRNVWQLHCARNGVSLKRIDADRRR